MVWNHGVFRRQGRVACGRVCHGLLGGWAARSSHWEMGGGGGRIKKLQAVIRLSSTLPSVLAALFPGLAMPVRTRTSIR